MPLGTDELQQLPKAEVHVHLEGCFEVDDLVSLAASAGEPLPSAPEDLFTFSSFDGFLEFLSWSCGLVRTADQAVAAAYRFAGREFASGVTTADVIVNPTHWAAWRSDVPGLIRALDEGFTQAESDGLPPVGLCISLLRDQSASEALELVDMLIDLRHPRVVALSIDGNEKVSGRTGARFADAFRRAGSAGLGRTVHAGESSGPEGVRDAIDLLGADRLDHGVRAAEDPSLVSELADRGIPLGICVGSNLTLGIYPEISAHPIEALRQAGVKVSVNTDDPAFVGTDLVAEYRRCIDAFSWTGADVLAVAATSLEACFMARQRS